VPKYKPKRWCLVYSVIRTLTRSSHSAETKILMCPIRCLDRLGTIEPLLAKLRVFAGAYAATLSGDLGLVVDRQGSNRETKF
jgi:hypothetical protein